MEPTQTTPGAGGRLRGFLDDVGGLLRAIPAVHAAARPGAAVDDMDGWGATAARFAAYRSRGGDPALVGVLFGPTGAGKSTLFRLLTGLDVPAGGHVRPLTHGCVAAVPGPVADAGPLDDLFPGYARLEEIAAPEGFRLLTQSGPADTLYYSRYDPPPGQGTLPLVLVDVPDFNAVDESNWAKAERMLARAEVVVFTVYQEAYKDRRVVDALIRCCGVAGFVAVLFTKTDPDAAPVIWADLLTWLKTDPTAETVRRRDGRPVHEFLAACPVYYSPRAPAPGLDDVKPLAPASPPFTSLLRGEDGEEILLAGLLEPTSRAVRSSRGLLAEARALVVRLDDELARARGLLPASADRVAVSELPIGKIVQIVAEESVKLRTSGRLLKWVGTSRTVFMRVSSGLKTGWSRLASLFTRKRPPELRDRKQVERERLREECAGLFTAWRSMCPADAVDGGLLSVARHQPLRAAFEAVDLPDPGKEWEGFVREEARGWAAAHPVRSLSMALAPDVLAVVGLGLMVLDLGVTGGLVTAKFMVAGRVMNLDVIAASAGLGASAGVILKVLDSMGLTQLVQRASLRWREVRKDEVAAHIDAHLFTPTFEPRRVRLDALKNARLDDCDRVCARLEAAILTSVT